MQITIQLPDDLVQSAHLTEAELLWEIAIVLFYQERITLGRASLLCGMDQIEFQKLLASRGITIH